MFKFFQTKAGQNFMAKLYGIGASVVILGAMFKILHWPGADIMLTLGLTTEAVIFFISAFEKPHVDYDWSLVYPELTAMDDDGNKSPVRELDNMLEKAKVDEDLIQSLGDGLRKVNQAANGIGSVVDIVVTPSVMVAAPASGVVYCLFGLACIVLVVLAPFETHTF